ncbi:hypothetical protein MVEN_01159200 [Mycena venus]|uniref:Cullin N-terminal domain-containing protein n=1 Tax=Mycena venus TaxID=2733690 RepID=A0A8H7CXV3_9AGAR|nr:hypothetical protein MVEN_01159200 [Mycena venus]
MPITFGNTLSGGIQDISAVLSLVGTEQCEQHVGSALRGGGHGGYLYAAITPVSIFGSLGVAKAALMILFASLPRFGAQRLQHAGFDSAGDAVKMITLEGQRYVAETSLEELLKKHFIRDIRVLRMNVARDQFIKWNFQLLAMSCGIAIVGVIPYLSFSIHHDTSFLPLAIFFPLCRVVGGLLCVAAGQLLLQYRIALILRQRILFKLIGDPLKRRNDLKIPTKGIVWDEAIASEICLFSLHKFLAVPDNITGQQPFIGHLRWSLNQLHRNLQGLSFAADQGRTGLGSVGRPTRNALLWVQTKLEPLVTTSWLHWVLWTATLLGFGMSLLGYIGCFTVVQDPRSTTTDIYIWLSLEFLLALFRMGIWAWNPAGDDSAGLQIQLDSKGMLAMEDAEQTDQGHTVRIVNETEFLTGLTAYSGPVDINAIPRIEGYEPWYAWVKNDTARVQGRDDGILCIVLKGRHRLLCMQSDSHPTNADNVAGGPALHRASLVESALLGNAVRLPTSGDRLNADELDSLGSQIRDAVFKHHDFIMAIKNSRNNTVTVNVSWLLSDPVFERNVRQDSGYSEKQDLTVTVEILKKTIARILAPRGPLRYTEYIGAYTTLSNNTRALSAQLYDGLSNKLNQHTLQIGQFDIASTGDSNMSLSQYYDRHWEVYSKAIPTLSRLFTILDRNWVKDQREEGRDIETIANVALQCWKMNVLESEKLVEQLSVWNGPVQGNKVSIARYNQVSAFFRSRDLGPDDFEQMYLLRRVAAVTLRGHTGVVSSIAFSSEGMHIVSGSLDNTVQMWDAMTGEAVAQMVGHRDGVTCVRFSPDSSRVVSGSRDSTVRIWDAQSGVLIGVLEESTTTSGVTSVEFSPDGRTVISGSSEGTVRIWDAGSGRIRAVAAGHGAAEVTSVAFSPDGRRSVSGSTDNIVRIWDTDKLTLVMSFKGHNGPVYSVAFSPDGRRVASGSGDKTVNIWDTERGAFIAQLVGPTMAVTSVSFSSDGSRVVSGSLDGKVRIWDAGSAALIHEFETDHVTSVAFSTDGHRVASGSSDKKVRIWDVDSTTFVEPSTPVRSPGFSADGGHLV